MRTFSSFIIAAVAAVPLFTLMPSSNAHAQGVDRERRSGTIGNYGYRDSSGIRSRGEGRSQRQLNRGGAYQYGNDRWDGRRGHGYRDRGHYGYRGYSGYRPISYGYTSGSTGYGADDCAPTSRRSARTSYGYAPTTYRYRSYGTAPVAYGYADDDSYGYGSYGSYGYSSYGSYGYSPGISVGLSW